KRGVQRRENGRELPHLGVGRAGPRRTSRVYGAVRPGWSTGFPVLSSGLQQARAHAAAIHAAVDGATRDRGVAGRVWTVRSNARRVPRGTLLANQADPEAPAGGAGGRDAALAVSERRRPHCCTSVTERSALDGPGA